MSNILGANYQDAESFEGVFIALAYFLVTFQNSIGNISSPSIGFLKDSKVANKITANIIVYMIYMFWLLA